MFTGLVQGLATVVEVRQQPPGVRLVVAAAPLAAAAIGDSIALNGCCLTVVQRDGDHVAFEAGPETLARTNLGRLSPGKQVNFESSLRIGDPLGGHFVTGHIDGLGTLAARHDDRDWSTCWFACEPALTRLMASKGSVAVDGVSLTLVDVERERFSVALIPHTLGMTTLGQLAVGDPVNLETDLLAKYVDRSVQAAVVGRAS
jgi:riboflavin synthase